MDTLTIDGESYLSSKRAAKITGYAKDYVGQLCREGRIDAKLVGRNWYVREQSIREHRFGQDDKTHDVNKSVSKTSEHTDVSSVSSVHYISEKVTPLPDVKTAQHTAQENTTISDTNPEHEDTHYVAAMQKAWQEWFTKVQDREPPQASGEDAKHHSTGGVVSSAMYQAEEFIEDDIYEDTSAQIGDVSVKRIRNDPLPPPTEFTDIMPPQEYEPEAISAPQQEHHDDPVEADDDITDTSSTHTAARIINATLMVVALLAFLLLTANFVYRNGKSGLESLTGTTVYTAR